MSNIIHVMLADDHELVRDGIKLLLESEKDIIVVDEASDGAEAIEKIELHPDVDILIVDIRMPKMTGIEVVAELKKRNNPVKTLVLSMHDSEEYVLKSVESGADGYLLKGSSKEEFLKALHAIIDGGKYFSGDVSSILVNNFNRTQAPSQQASKTIIDDIVITKREREILSELLAGKSNKEIAESLAISKRTAEVHRFNLMKKLDVKNLIELSNRATELGLN
ncbi:MAG: response regulator transcription factor [Flavobacteriales bacterium]|nr:response regulator transcription factor [Flavobacteriales bacterium]